MDMFDVKDILKESLKGRVSYDKLEKLFRDLYIKYSALQSRCMQLEQRSQEIASKNVEFVMKNKKLKDELDVFKAKCSELNTQTDEANENIKKENGRLLQRVKELEKSLEESQEASSKSIKQIKSELNQQLKAKFQDEIEKIKSGYNEEIKTLNHAIEEMKKNQENVGQAKETIKHLKSEINNEKKRAESIETELNNEKKRSGDFEAEIIKLKEGTDSSSASKEEITRLKEEIVKLESQNKSFQEILDNNSRLLKEKEELEKRTENLKLNLEKLSSNKESLIKTALIINDLEGTYLGIKNILTGEGIEFTLAESGDEALKLIEKQEFDMVFTDIKLSDMSGNYIYRYIQKSKPHLSDKVVFFISENDYSKSVKFLESISNKHFIKPANQEDVATFIRTRAKPWLF